MAQLAVGIAGGLLGSLVGMPQLGFLAGSLLGSVLFPSNGGPKLTDLRVLTSAYGQMIPVGGGTMRIGGNVIFGSTLTQNSHLFGKGGLAPTTYTYNWSGGVGIAAGPIGDITRIWADTKLVFDKTGQSKTKQFDQYKLKHTVYLGTEDQTPDPVHEHQVGADNALAYRGLAYVVFDNIPVADYGNRIPQFSFEVSFDTISPDLTKHALTFTHTVQNDNALINWATERGYFIVDNEGIVIENLITGTEIQFVPDATIYSGFSRDGGTESLLCIGFDGYVYVNSGVANARPIWKLDPDSLVAVGKFGFQSSGANQDTFYDTVRAVPVQINGRNFMVCASIFAGVGVFCTDTMQATLEDVPNTITFAEMSSSAISLASAPVPTNGPATIYACGQPNFGGGGTGNISLYRLVTDGASVQAATIVSLAATDVNVHWTQFTAMIGPVYDVSDGNVIIGVANTHDANTTGQSQYYIVKLDAASGAVLWTSPVNFFSDAARLPISASNIVAGNIAIVGNDQETTKGQGDGDAGVTAIYVIQTENGSSVRQNWPTVGNSPQYMVYDDTVGGMVLYDNNWGILYPNRAAADAVDLGTLIKKFTSRVGYVDADLDLTQLAGIDCEGYVVSSQAACSDDLKPLAIAFQFDVVESDNVLKFVKRGGASVVTVPSTDLAVVDTKLNTLATETRTQEVDLPKEITLTFYDPTADYQSSTQYARRPFNPVPSMFSNNVITQNIPISMEPTFAKQLCDFVLYSAWFERTGVKAKLPWRYLPYDPTDIITITMSDATEILTRSIGMDLGVDWAIDYQGVSEDADTYVSIATGQGTLGFPPQVIAGTVTSRLFLLDVPILADLSDPGQSKTVMYYAAGSYDGVSWPGLELYKSLDGGSYTDLNGIYSTMTWGSLLSPLIAPPDGPYILDKFGQITITAQNGASNITSCSYADMCNGANACIVFNQISGIAEVVQFMNVVTNGDGSLTLSYLFRGRRGTDPYVGLHVAGESFVLLTDSGGNNMNGVQLAPMSLSDLNVQRFYKGVTQGTLIDNAIAVQFVDTGRTLKPYAPGQVAAALSGSDIDLTWQRRTRLNGFWGNGTDSGVVPLQEATEGYQVDIYNALGDTVLRTLSIDFGATPTLTPGVTYTSADIVADFGTTPTELTLAVYQMSAVIGRGFTNKVTVLVS